MMNWQCNIDKRGRYFRGVLGFLTLGAGIYLDLLGRSMISGAPEPVRS